MDLVQYTQQTLQAIAENRLSHGIIVEAENRKDALFYVTECARVILQTDNLDNHPDFFAIHPSGKMNVIKIEAIRELIDCAQKTPNRGEQKIFVIFEANRLNKNAANALLKTLEEPPTDTTLFLTTTAKYLLSSTIISRCVSHHLPENPINVLPPELCTWMNQLELFLQKLSADVQTASILEIFALVDGLAKKMETLESALGENASNKDTQRTVLQQIIEKIWNIFHLKSPAHFVEQSVEIVSKSSIILAVNGSFLHVIENILLQLYGMNSQLIGEKI